MFKKAIAIALAMMAAMSLAGCGASAESTATQAAKEAAKETEAPAKEAATEGTAETVTEKAKEEENTNPFGEIIAKLGDDKTVRLATPGNYSPFTIFDQGTEEWSGFEIDLWNIICERAGLELELVKLDNPATFAELDLNRVDTVAKQISITPARKEKYDFTQPFFFSPYCLTVREDNDEIQSWEDMEGKTIALSEGSAMNEFIAELDPENKVNKKIYEGFPMIAPEIMLGRADAMPYAYLVLPYAMKDNPDIKLKSVDIDNPIYTEVNAYPFARTDRGAALLELTDMVLDEMMADGSYAKLCIEWFGIDVMETQPAIDYFKENPKK